jgi:hypothetical protein
VGRKSALSVGDSGRHGRPKTEENNFGKPAKHRCEKFRYAGSFRVIPDRFD